MRINHNIAALNTYRQLSSANEAGAKSMEKLSSGLRINRAGDDAAGLAISEKMRGQIRGLDQAQRNSQDGISMIQTAEGALNETHDILQRMRELATQAANDTNTGDDRKEIQNEMNQLTSEINRIGNTTEFNTQKLLKGGTATNASINGSPDAGSTDLSNFVVTAASTLEGAHTLTVASGAAITVGEAGGDASNIAIDSGSSLSGAHKIVVTEDIKTGSVKDLTSATVSNLSGLTYDGTGTDTNINIEAGMKIKFVDNTGNWDISVTDADDNVITTLNVLDASFTGAAIDLGEGFSVTLAAEPASAGTETFELEGNSTFKAQLFESDGTTDASGGTGPVTVAANDTGVDLGNGVTADFGGTLNDAAETTVTFGTAQTATLTRDSDSSVVGQAAVSANGSVSNLGGSGFSFDVGASPQDGTIALDFNAATSGANFSASFQIGANTDQSFGIELNDMRSSALGISEATGGDADTTVTINGKTVTAVYTSDANSDVTDGTSNSGVERALDVSTHDNATAAISVLDNAINKVSSERSKLGAYQNRLEHTINNLGTSSENLTAAESRVRDVDMAKEMMNQTKESILAQASQAMLAKANQNPQGVLQLLR